MKLRTKFAIVLLILVLVLSGVVYGELELYKQRAIGQVESNVDETATLTAEQIESSLIEKRDYVGYVASQPAAARLNGSGPYTQSFLDNSRFVAAQVIAPNGTVVAYRGDVSEQHRQKVIGSNLSDEPYFKESIDGKVFVNDTEYVSAVDKYVLVISAPILDDGTIVGVLAAAIYADQYSFFQVLGPLETNAQTVRVTANDKTLHPSHTTFDQSITESAVVSSTGWQVVISRDGSGLTARLKELALMQGASLLVVLFAVVTFGIWEYNANLRQTDRLLSGFRALREGEYDQTLDLTSGDEWAQISEGFNDLSAGLARREAEIRERGQRLEILNRVLRHNLRNDMTVIVNYAELIAEQVESETLEMATEKIQSKGWGLIDLGEKARQIESAVENAEQGTQAIDLVPLTEEILAQIWEDYANVAVEEDLPDEAVVAANPALNQAIEELCENACKHTKSPNPILEVAIEHVDDVVELTVADNGPGIPEQEYSVLAAGRETQLEHGSGLGLWLVHWIVTKSGGELSVADREPTGAIVTLTLPTGDEQIEREITK